METTDAQLDDLIMKAATPEWSKIAYIISQTYDALGAEREAANKDLAKTIAERVYVLVDSGQLVAQGNMRRWREGEVRVEG